MALLRLSACDPDGVMFPTHFRVAVIAGCTDAEISAIMHVAVPQIQKWRKDYE